MLWWGLNLCGSISTLGVVMPGMTMITVTVSSIPYDLALPDDNDQESMMIHIGEDSSGAVYA